VYSAFEFGIYKFIDTRSIRIHSQIIHPSSPRHTQQKPREDEHLVSQRTQSRIYGTEHREHQNTETLVLTEERVKSNKAVAERAH
jgi:hypothetical protein